MQNIPNLILAVMISITISSSAYTSEDQKPMTKNIHTSSSQSNETENKKVELLRELALYVQSDSSELHLQFLNRLSEPSVLSALNPQTDFINLLDVLAKNSASTAQEAFIALAVNESFLANDDRALSLVRASQHINSPSQLLVKFWDRYSQPEDGFTPITIKVLLANGSAAAIDLLEKKLTDTTHDDEEKIAWMRMNILQHRNDLLLLQTCQRLLESKLTESLRIELVDVLFDYKPEQWYRPAVYANPPELKTATQESLNTFSSLAHYSLNQMTLTKQQRAAVEKRIQEIEEIRHAE